MNNASTLRYVAAIGLLSACTSPSSPPVEACAVRISTPEHPRAARLQAALDAATATRVPAALALVRDADGVWLGASGRVDLEHGVEAQTCHRYPIGSISKTFAAALLLMLVDDGRVSLDDPIASHLPADVADGILHSDRITVRMVVNHTSGVPSYSDIDWYLDLLNRPGLERTIAQALRSTYGGSSFEPGTDYRYSNTNYLLVGEIVRHVTGRPFGDVLRERVIEPLGLDATVYAEDRPFDSIAKGYLDLYGDGELVESSWDTFLPTIRGPNSGVESDVLDVQRFIDALLRERTLISDEAIAAMQTVALHSEHPPEEQLGYGLGLMHHRFEEGESYGHSGSVLGFETYAFYFPEADVTIVVAVNAFSLSDGAIDDNSIHAYLQTELLPALRRAALTD